MVEKTSASLSEPVPTGQASGHHKTRTRLRGTLGVWAIVFMVAAAASPLGVMGGTVPIGIGIGNGVAFPATFVIALIILLLFAVGYTTLTKYVPNAGAFYSYVGKGFGDKAGLATALLALIAYLAETIAVYGLLAGGADSLFQSWNIDLPWQLYAVVAILFVAFLGHRNVNVTARVLGFLMAGEVLIVLALDIAVLGRGGGPQGLSTGFLDPSAIVAGAPGLALLFAFLSFLGVDATAVYRNEARNPNRTTPRATYAAVTLVGLFYIISTWLIISAWGDDKAIEIATKDPVNMVPIATHQYLGAVGEQVVQVLFVTSLFACVLAFHNIVARYLFTLANRGAMPRRIGLAHHIHGSPHIPSAIVSGLAVVAIIIASIVGMDPVNELYTWLAGACTVGFILLLIATAAACVPFFARLRREGTLTESTWKAFIAPVISCVLLVGVFVLVMVNLTSLVGGSVSVAVAVILVLVAAMAAGVIIGFRRPDITLDVDEDGPGAEVAARSGDVRPPGRG